MANKFQVKRTTVSGRTPNTTNSGNTHFIDTGELALNLTDGKMFSSNGTVYFEVGANLQNLSIASNATFGSAGKIVANGSFGTSGQVLTSNGTTMYWSTVSGGGGSGTVTQVNTGIGLSGGPISTNGTISILANSGIVANSSGIFANPGNGLVVNATGIHVNSGVQYDSLVSKFNGKTKDFVLKANNVASGVYSSKQLIVTSGGSTLDNVDYTKTDYFNSPIFFNDFVSGYRVDRTALVVNVTSTSISRDSEVYQLDSNNCVVFTATLVESNTTSLTLTNVRTDGSVISTDTSPVIAGTIVGRIGGSAPVANLTASFVSVISFANAPTKYNTNLKIRRFSASDITTESNRIFNNVTPFTPINIMLSE
jgi:hypothetical protein